jgi:hypothetical protein
MKGTKVYGASDDLIEFEGDVYGEVGHMSDRSTKVTMSDGTELLVKYGKPEHGGVWWVRLKTAGPLFDRIDECFDENAPVYSDVAHFKPGLTGARCKGRPVD